VQPKRRLAAALHDAGTTPNALDCGSPLPLFLRQSKTFVVSIVSLKPARPPKSARGLAHSTTLARRRTPRAARSALD